MELKSFNIIDRKGQERTVQVANEPRMIQNAILNVSSPRFVSLDIAHPLVAGKHTKKTNPFNGFKVYAYRGLIGIDYASAMRNLLAAISKSPSLEVQHGDRIAAIILEPLQGEGGDNHFRPEFFAALRGFADSREALLIYDEVQTGFARTGDLFACDREGVVPDLVVTAKGIAGGLPLSAVTGRAEIMDAPHAGGLGGTYGGNPLACAAALAAIETVEQDGLVERARAVEAFLKERLHALQARDARVGDVRGRGAMIAVELVRPGTTDPDPDLARAVSAAAHAEGVIVLTCGTYGNVLRLLPPLAIDDTLLGEGLDVLEAAFASTLVGAAQ